MQEGGDVVCLDDAACAPDLHDSWEGDGPFVLLVRDVDYAHALDVGCETGCIHRFPQVFNKLLPLFLVFDVDFGREERPVEGFLYVFALASEGGHDAKVVCCGERGCRDV